jgi:hypothetical protein
MKRIVMSVVIVVTSAAPAFAASFSWTIRSVSAATSHADSHDVNGFDLFGSWAFDDIGANVHLGGMIEQYTAAIDDRLSISRSNGATSLLSILKATLDDSEFLPTWAPVVALGLGGGLAFDEADFSSPTLHLFGGDSGSTVRTPEPGTLALVGLGVALSALRRRVGQKAAK